MVHTAIANDSIYKYLQKTSGKCNGCAVGLVLGQPNAQKDYLIHLTKTPLQTHEDGETSNKKQKSPKSIDEINDVFVANHAKTATRTLSGGMYVIGIFVVSQSDVLAPFSAKVKTILSKINQHMEANKDLCGNPPTGTRLVINFNQLSQQVTAKCYDINTCIVKPAEVKFQENANVWKELEYILDLDSLFPIVDKDIELPLRKHMASILSCVRNNLEVTTFLYDGEFKDSSETVDTIGQKKKAALRSKSATTNNAVKENKVSQVSILLPNIRSTQETNSTEVHSCGGIMKSNGQLSGKLHLHPTTTIENAAKSVREDIIRSLSFRLEMHCDSLTDEEHNSTEDSNIIHEPPRRVLVTIEGTNEVLNDYLFPGEGTEDSALSIDEVLDAKIEENNIVELEGQADIKELMKSCESNMELPILLKHTNKCMYYMGAGFAIAVLAISLLVHFLFKK